MKKLLFILFIFCFVFLSCSNTDDSSSENNTNEVITTEETDDEPSEITTDNPNTSNESTEEEQNNTTSDKTDEENNEENNIDETNTESTETTSSDTTDEIIDTPTTDDSTEDENNNEENTTTEENPIIFHLVTFEDEEGNLLDSRNVIHGETITDIPSPTKEDYKFKAWYLNNNKFDFSTPINEDTVLVGVFSNNVATLTYDLDNWGVFNKYDYSNLPVKLIVQTRKDDPTSTAVITIPYSDVKFNYYSSDTKTAEIETSITYYEYIEYSPSKFSKEKTTKKFKFYLSKQDITELIANRYNHIKGFNITARAEKDDERYYSDYSFSLDYTWTSYQDEGYGVYLFIRINPYK